jgi:ABC-2 type transport system ATP-binding protein
VFAVDVRGLRKVFRTREKAAGLRASLSGLVAPRFRDVEAVAAIDLRIEPGELLAFIGPNGAGKSTTIKMLTGILYPTSGEATVLGLVPWRERQKLAYRIASVFGQRSQLWYHLPPADSLDLLAHIYELEPSLYRTRLGQLVEPTIGLDVVAKQHIRQHIRELNEREGTTVFLTSHDAGDVEQLCRRVVVINHGKVVFDDSLAAMRQQFLRNMKRISLKLLSPLPSIELPGARVVRQDDYEVAVEIDTSRLPIETAVGALMDGARVADISIEDPPLEEIIAAMY